MKNVALIAASAALLATGTASARTSSDVEFRGYNECLAAAKQESNGLVAGRTYLIERNGGDAEYFINATRWEEGVRNYVRINCQTTARGQRLVSANIAEGQFTTDPTGRVLIEVAGK